MIRTGTKDVRTETHLCGRLLHPFSPDWCYQPGLKVPYEPGLVLAGALPIRTGTNGPISPDSSYGLDGSSVWKPCFLLVCHSVRPHPINIPYSLFVFFHDYLII